jgi:mannose-1-phosphate guanylyltransferase
MNSNNFCVIMAGGIGSRFWPLSRTQKPKQFLDILGTGKSLIRQTFERFKTIIPAENFFVVTNMDYIEIVKEHIPELSYHQIIGEPLRRNTAPCIAYANFKIKLQNPNANIVVAPSDHLILKENDFLDVVKLGLDYVEKNDALVTLGIKPSRIETGYGYIQVDNHKSDIKVNKTIRKVKTFTEKPDFELAKVFFESGEFYWNSGIFFWSLKSILKAFDKHLPDINHSFGAIENQLNTENENNVIENTYTHCKNISIDYGIMEKAENVDVICSDFGWSDLGTWGSLYEHLDKDTEGNSYQGENILGYENKNCLINLPNDKIAVIQGLEDYIVVESANILLICKKKDEQKIKNYVNDVKLKNVNVL